MGLIETSARVGTTRQQRQHLVADATVVLQIGPTAGKLYQDSAGSFGDPSGYFDQPSLPRARLALAQWISFPTPIVKLATLATSQRFVGYFGVRRWWWRIGRDTA